MFEELENFLEFFFRLSGFTVIKFSDIFCKSDSRKVRILQMMKINHILSKFWKNLIYL